MNKITKVKDLLKLHENANKGVYPKDNEAIEISLKDLKPKEFYALFQIVVNRKLNVQKLELGALSNPQMKEQIETAIRYREKIDNKKINTVFGDEAPKRDVEAPKRNEAKKPKPSRWQGLKRRFSGEAIKAQFEKINPLKRSHSHSNESVDTQTATYTEPTKPQKTSDGSILAGLNAAEKTVVNGQPLQAERQLFVNLEQPIDDMIATLDKEEEMVKSERAQEERIKERITETLDEFQRQDKQQKNLDELEAELEHEMLLVNEEENKLNQELDSEKNSPKEDVSLEGAEKTVVDGQPLQMDARRDWIDQMHDEMMMDEEIDNLTAGLDGLDKDLQIDKEINNELSKLEQDLSDAKLPEKKVDDLDDLDDLPSSKFSPKEVAQTEEVEQKTTWKSGAMKNSSNDERHFSVFLSVSRGNDSNSLNASEQQGENSKEEENSQRIAPG